MLLAIDTCANHCAAGLFQMVEGAVDTIHIETEIMDRGHAERIVPILDVLFANTGARVADVSLIAVTTGPGSFTGSRIGVATARALALPKKITVAGVTTHQGIARAVVGTGLNHSSPFTVILNARRGELFVQRYDANGDRLGDAVMLGTLDAQAQLATSAGACFGIDSDIGAHLGESVSYKAIAPTILIEAVAQCGAAMAPPIEKPQPVYARAPDAKRQVGKSIARR